MTEGRCPTCGGRVRIEETDMGVRDLYTLSLDDPLVVVDGGILYRDGNGQYRLGLVFEGRDDWPKEIKVRATLEEVPHGT